MLRCSDGSREMEIFSAEPKRNESLVDKDQAPVTKTVVQREVFGDEDLL